MAIPSSEPETTSPTLPSRSVRTATKALLHALCMVVTSPLAATCWCEARLASRTEVFVFWGQALALVPGLPGKYLRRGFYTWTLQACAPDCEIGFLTTIHDRRAELGPRSYLGQCVTVGFARIGAGCLVASRVSLLSGGRQHEFGTDGRLTPFDRAQARQIELGEETWIGEGAILMASVGSRCIVGAGSVISQPVPDGVLVAGNPARFVRRLMENEWN
jgi:acetyltransferase-like isoleucine patch superfamily enzyme